ncbi:MAG: 16S rRNA (guanine(966)-N(2))-methyltransferase RsmD [Rubrobacteraceae bacterium]
MRIITGAARGVRLAPVPSGVRPTSDRVRESLFNSLGQFFDGGAVLDLYAGTGALGIEALSRGCDRAVFVERDGNAVATIRDNLRRTGFEDGAEVIRGDSLRSLETLRDKGCSFRLILLDPPYKIAAAAAENALARSPALLTPDGQVVVESGDEPEGSTHGKGGITRRYGGTFVTIFGRHELL